MSGADVFHAHLDVCHQCESQPFNMCATGAVLLRAAVDDGARAPLTGEYDGDLFGVWKRANAPPPQANRPATRE